MKNTLHMISGILMDVIRHILPQITQKKICENLRNLRLKAKVDNYEMSMILT